MRERAGPELMAYQPEDQPEFAKLVNDVHAEFGFNFDPQLDADLGDPLRHYRSVWLLKSEGRVVGSVAIATDGNHATLKRMYLRPALRGQGWGRRLLEIAIQSAIKAGSVDVTLDTSHGQVAAQRLYERAGFQMVRTLDGGAIYRMDLAPNHS